MKSDNYKFIINTITDWNESPRARHQVANALAKNNTVIFVSSNRIGIPAIRFHQVSDNLKVITPVFPFDSRIRIRIPFLNNLYQHWLFRKLAFTYPEFCVINFDFTANQLFKYFKKGIYYCNDDHIGLSYILNIRWIARYQEVCEKTVAGKSIFCVGTSKYLVNKLKQYNANTFEIKLGAPVTPDIPPLSRGQKSEKMNVGLVGFLETIYHDLLIFLLSKKDLNFTFIGPVKPKDQKAFKQYKNLRFTGKLTENDLYNEVRKFDVGIIPYNVNSRIDRTPNKLWLYLALGIPVVISNIKGIKEWTFPRNFVYLADSHEDFYNYILKANKDNNKMLAEKRIEFAKNNSWDTRVLELLKICSAYLQ